MVNAINGSLNFRNITSMRAVQDRVLATDEVVLSGLWLYLPDLVAAERKVKYSAMLLSPMHYRNGSSGSRRITGFASTTFTWDGVLNGTTDTDEVYVVVTCPEGDSSVDTLVRLSCADRPPCAFRPRWSSDGILSSMQDDDKRAENEV